MMIQINDTTCVRHELVDCVTAEYQTALGDRELYKVLCYVKGAEHPFVVERGLSRQDAISLMTKFASDLNGVSKHVSKS